MLSNKLENIVECEYCGLFVDISSKKSDNRLKCPRCRLKLPQSNGHSFDSLYYSISAFLVFILLNIYPLISLSLGAKELKTTLLKSVLILYDEGFIFVSLVILFTIIISPIVTILIIIYSFIHNHTKIRPIPTHYIYNLFHFFKNWGFIDVFILSIIVAYIKLVGMISNTRFDVGFYLIIFYAFLFFMANRKFEIHSVFKER